MTLPRGFQTHQELSQMSQTPTADGLKIRQFFPMCLLVFERRYLSYFLADFKKLHDQKKLKKKIFQMRLIPGL